MDPQAIKAYSQRQINLNRKKSRKEIEIDDLSRSLYIFGSDNWLRMQLKSLIENPYFEGFIYHMIALNSLLLALDEPKDHEDPMVNTFRKDTI